LANGDLDVGGAEHSGEAVTITTKIYVSAGTATVVLRSDWWILVTAGDATLANGDLNIEWYWNIRLKRTNYNWRYLLFRQVQPRLC
jgi:hypothetical protein